MPKTSDMSDQEYELLVKNILEALLKAEGHQTIQIHHDVKIKGRSGQNHQIDVYWNFSVGGVVYQTAIECKRYKNQISVGRVRDFSAALDDIGNINGVMVTTSGYQSGAEIFASHKGIRLVVLRSPEDADLEGFIRTVELRITAAMRDVIRRDLEVSADWLVTNAHHIPSTGLQTSGWSQEFGLYQADGTLVRSWWDIENDLPTKESLIKSDPEEPSPCSDSRIFGRVALNQTFPNDASGTPLPRDTVLVHQLDVAGLHLKQDPLGLIPLKAASLGYRITDVTTTVRIDAPYEVGYVMKDVPDAEVRIFYNDNGAILPNPTAGKR